MSSKTSTRERRARVEAMKAEQRRAQRRRNFIWVGAALTAAVVLVAGVVWVSSRGSGGSTVTGDDRSPACRRTGDWPVTT